MKRDPEEMIRFFLNLNTDEGCVTIAPHQEPFRRLQRSFLEGIRTCPASITSPPGSNPFTLPLHREGRWVLMWVPD